MGVPPETVPLCGHKHTEICLCLLRVVIVFGQDFKVTQNVVAWLVVNFVWAIFAAINRPWVQEHFVITVEDCEVSHGRSCQNKVDSETMRNHKAASWAIVAEPDCGAI